MKSGCDKNTPQSSPTEPQFYRIYLQHFPLSLIVLSTGSCPCSLRGRDAYLRQFVEQLAKNGISPYSG